MTEVGIMNVTIAIGIFVTLVVVLIGWTIQRAFAKRARASNANADAVQQLVRQGVSAEVAQTQAVQSASAQKAAARKGGLKLAAIGIGLFAAGIVITNLSYTFAWLTGDRYIVTTGLYLAGVFALGVGLSRVLTGR
jgi:hypothetical protein